LNRDLVPDTQQIEMQARQCLSAGGMTPMSDNCAFVDFTSQW
jgi:hypothetical protein